MNTPSDELAAALREFQQLLSPDIPVSEAALRAAMSDNDYAARLFASREQPTELAALLAHPPVAELPTTYTTQRPFTTPELAARAGQALWRWARSGFANVSPEVFERRERACLSCIHLSQPRHYLQRALSSAQTSDTPGNRLGNRVCGLCGCGLKKKLQLASENCPKAMVNNPSLSMWGEPVMPKR